MILYIIKSLKRKYNIYKMKDNEETIVAFGTGQKGHGYREIEEYDEDPDMPELLPEKVQKRLMRPLKEEVRKNARSIYDELPELMKSDVKRAEIAVLLAKTDYDRDYKRNLARMKKGNSEESDDGELKPKQTKFETLENKDEIYEYYQSCRKYSVTAKQFGISNFLVKKVVSQY